MGSCQWSSIRRRTRRPRKPRSCHPPRRSSSATPCPFVCCISSWSGSAAGSSCLAARQSPRTLSCWCCGMRSRYCAVPVRSPGWLGRPRGPRRPDLMRSFAINVVARIEQGRRSATLFQAVIGLSCSRARLGTPMPNPSPDSSDQRLDAMAAPVPREVPTARRDRASARS